MTTLQEPPVTERPVEQVRLPGRRRAVPDSTAEVLRKPSPRTRDDVLTAIGAAIGSLATVWLLYTKLLPFDGKVGFVVCWYLAFVVFYAGVTAITQPRHVVVDRVVTTAVIAAPTLIGAALLSTVVVIVAKGMPALVHPNFYFDDMAGVRPASDFDQGGIAHAIVGTVIEVGIAVAIAMPLGLLTAIYMSEVGGRGARLVRAVVEAMTALPSIVAGLFIYTVCIVKLDVPSSGFAAALALAVMALPIMARASDVVLRVVPGGLREASYALGATKWQTVWKVVLPTARPGLATALILGVARAVGETSPVLLTSGASTFMNADPFNNPMNSLPLFVYASVVSGNPNAEVRAYAAATVLLVVVLSLFVLARFVVRDRKPR